MEVSGPRAEKNEWMGVGDEGVRENTRTGRLGFIPQSMRTKHEKLIAT